MQLKFLPARGRKAVLDERGDWLQVSDGGLRIGRLKRDAAELLRPEGTGIHRRDAETRRAITKDADRRALSSFFLWCMKGKRHWAVNNPCYAVEIEGFATADDHEPVVLPVDECRALLKAAEKIKNGRSVPYVALCLFGGLRPFEAARLTWDQVNLKDGEIRLKGVQTKTGKGRIVVIDKTLKAWLSQYRKRGEIYRSGYEADLREIRLSIGYGNMP